MSNSAMLFGLGALLLGLLHIQFGGASSVLTELPSGPLFRVVGYPLHIRCNVSGFKDTERQKKFELRLEQLGKSQEINIISTDDANFAFNQFKGRVKNNEITLENLAPNLVLFTMTNLIVSDEGKYHCSVVNYEGTYDGVYSTEIVVKVIDNTLTVSSPDSTSVNLNEGDPLTLTCQASSNTVQHTHLSVTWYLRKNGEEHPHPIVSLDQDLTLIPGPRFKERYQAGAVRLDKVGEAMYRLSITRLEQSDQGSVYCEAQEWIQDPDRSWYSITQKDSEATTLNVKATDKVEVDRATLAVRISVQQETLQEGQELVVTCSVDNVLPGQLFSVAWLRGGSELARFGPTGVLQVGEMYDSQVTGGELMATKIGDRVHRLVLRPVRVQDQGGYLCRAWPQDMGADSSFMQGVAQDSGTKMVSISATESVLLVEMETESVADVTEGDKLQLICKVSRFRGQLSVTWEHKSGSTAASSFRHVMSLSHDGVMELGQAFAQRSVRVTRPAANVFTLELSDVIPSDAGTYLYTVSEWTAKPNGDVEKTHSQSRTCNVTVRLLENLLTLVLSNRNTDTTVGDNVELVCQVKGPSAATTLTWILLRNGAATPETILTRSPCGVITWQGGWQRRYQLRVEQQSPGKTSHKLLIAGASPIDEGQYQCKASVFLENRDKKMPLSNPLAVLVKRESKLSVSSTTSISSKANADVTIECAVSPTTPGSSRLAMTWREGTNRTILISGRDAVVTSPVVVATAGDERRISMRRTKGPSFELTIRQARVEDSGRYSCVVVEWLQDPDGNWFDLPPVQTTTELHVIEAESNLFIGGGGATNLTVSPSQSFVLPCTISAQSSQTSAFQVVWFWRAETGNREERPIFTAYPNGTLQDSSGKPERLRFDRPLLGVFSLAVSGAMPSDSGAYHCQVEEWLLFPYRRKVGAVERSQEITVDVRADLQGHTEQHSAVLPGILTGLILILLVVILVLVLKIRRGQRTGPPKDLSLWAEGHPLEPKPTLDE